MNIKIPAVSKSFYSDSAASQNLKKIETVIRPKYGKIIDRISEITGVPVPIIESFIFIESAGNEKAQTPYATGLMQVSKAAASDAIVFEKTSGRLSPEEIQLLKKHLGASRWAKIEKAKGSIGTYISANELFNPEFNILVGTIILGQLINEFTENGKPRLDKVVVIYNRGKYDKVSKKVAKFQGNTNELLAVVPQGAKDYILKLIGENGTLDLIV